MNHFFIIFAALLFLGASFCAGLALFLYFRMRKPGYLFFTFFFSILALKTLICSILLYIKTNLLFETTMSILVYTVGIDVSYLILFLFPFLFTRMLAIPFRKAL